MERNIYIQNTPLDQAIELFIGQLEKRGYFRTKTEVIDVLSSVDRILSSAVSARRSSPHYTASAMDGIAVKAVDTYGANETNPIILDNSQYLEVDTGEYVPRSFDAVIMIEDVNFRGEQVEIIKPAVPWQHIRSVGEDLVVMDMIAPSCTRIGPYELASFITAAISEVEVVKKPVVAVIPTGTELLDQGSEDMEPGEIVESNSRMLIAMCQEWGAEALRHDIVIDDRTRLLEAVEEVKDQADMIIICSGSSAGREDYTSSIIQELGELLVHGIATKPGKPAILGIIDNKPVIGVPGYPISAQLVFTLFARPVIYKKMGLSLPADSVIECRAARKVASSMGVDEFIYVNAARINNDYIAYPLNRGAGITTSLVKADGIMHIKRGDEGLEAGGRCTVILKKPRELVDRTLVCIGSHDISIDFLADIMQGQHNKRLISTNVGSMGGIMSLMKNECHFAGVHLLDTNSGDYNITYLKKYLSKTPWILLTLLNREQGLIVQKGNPCNIKEIKDLSELEVRYINRQKGAGTRVLFDYLLEKNNIHPSSVNGYNREEYTHLAVAAAVKNDAADCALGIYASAKALNLDFIPISEERYDLCILPDLLAEQDLDLLMQVISSSIFKNRVMAFGGYSTDNTGQVVYSSQCIT
ncbi:molybdopterin biosynthesis protein moea / periplasmic molybdate-binding domain [hydrocarbon metagenome]|uniref:Molybdopterin biosynthesis protein moea / periplasmic molybdate-binding domain n=1 Tax=hydrocarbon metagenome TaxID=938273 RepID=A0A0W8E674_9ZZZZ